MAEKKVKILMAGRKKSFHRILRDIVERAGAFDIVGEAGSGREIAELTEILSPNIVVIDVDSPANEFVAATKKISDAHRPISILAMLHRQDTETIIQMLDAGAFAVVSKDTLYENVFQLLHLVSSLPVFFPLESQGATADRAGTVSPEKYGVSVLSRREREIVSILAEGKTSKQIAESLFISVRTVENHRKRIMQKLDARNLADLTRFAIRHGLTQL